MCPSTPRLNNRTVSKSTLAFAYHSPNTSRLTAFLKIRLPFIARVLALRVMVTNVHPAVAQPPGTGTAVAPTAELPICHRLPGRAASNAVPDHRADPGCHPSNAVHPHHTAGTLSGAATVDCLMLALGPLLLAKRWRRHGIPAAGRWPGALPCVRRRPSRATLVLLPLPTTCIAPSPLPLVCRRGHLCRQRQDRPCVAGATADGRGDGRTSRRRGRVGCVSRSPHGAAAGPGEDAPPGSM